jgi:hypothetical protein
MTRRDGHSALRVRDGQLEVFDPHPSQAPVIVDIDYTQVHRQRSTAAGFGFAIPLLDGYPPAKHPWLTPAVIHVEQAIEEHLADPTQVFLTSVSEAGDVTIEPVQLERFYRSR